LNQRALWGAVAVFALAAIAVFTLRHRARSFPCPTRADETSRQVLVENASVASIKANNITVDAYAKNNSRRALVGLTVEGTLADGGVLRADAHNNEAGAPSLADAPILPGAARAVRLYFRSAGEVSAPTILRVVDCRCD
jgi:hypothetical protein